MKEVYKNIFRNQHFGLKDKAKMTLFYYSRKRGAERSWQNRHQKVFETNTRYQNPCVSTVESAHQKRWSFFRDTVDLSTLRICNNISGYADDRIIPEDIFVSDIEPTLLEDGSVHFLGHKSFYNRWFPKGIFPRDFLHRIKGQYHDSLLNPISWDKFMKIANKLSYPLVMKPNIDSYGGKDITFVKSSSDLIQFSKMRDNFVVQEQISQHDFFKRYNPVGLNTIRVYVYRSVNDNSLHVLNMALRMGRNGSLDNISMGGIHTMIRPDGSLNGYAVDKYGVRYLKHPNTGLAFNETIPFYDKLKELAIKVSKNVLMGRIIGLDISLDHNDEWRVIEVNTRGTSIRFSQYGGQPFFGKFTDEVIEYCTKNHWTLNKK